MNRVFKSDQEIDLNRCANALEKLVEIAVEKRRAEIRIYKESKGKRGDAKINDSPSSKKSSKSRTKKTNSNKIDPITGLEIDNVSGRLIQ
tara:strand:- start:421 stop:690 length:270 start_codon:yes stop_codon:yes gene_type:complete